MESTEDLLLNEKLVKELVLTLFVATDNRDWSEVQSCFHNKVTFDMSSLSGQPSQQLSPSEISENWEAGFDGIDHVHHQIGNIIVKLMEDEASVTCYGTTTHVKESAKKGNTRKFIGSYEFLLSRPTDFWKISAMRYNHKFLEGNVELE